MKNRSNTHWGATRRMTFSCESDNAAVTAVWLLAVPKRTLCPRIRSF